MNLYNRKIYIQYLLRFSYPMNLNKFWRSPFYKNMIKGKFIVVEGLDRSGKSTITRHIQRKLNAEAETLAMGFPDRTTKIGEMINEFLINKI